MLYNARSHALKILVAIFSKKTSLMALLSGEQEVAPLTKELCFGVCRHYFRLQAIADYLLAKRPKQTEVWLSLLLGLYQLYYMSKPEYAVVKETVALLDKQKWAKGLINAVLRNFCREQEKIIEAISATADFLYGQPTWLLKRLQKEWPQDWQDITKALDTHAPMTLRVNVLKSSVTHYLDCLHRAGLEASLHPLALNALILQTPCNVDKLPGFKEGWVCVQDAAAQIAAPLLSLEPGLRVLDACSAPGGKTGHILETEPNLAACVALDIDEKRLKKVAENLERLGLQADLLQADALAPQTWWDNQLFHRILLDAPCSATGVIRRHPDIKLLRCEEEVQEIIKVQEALLHTLWPLLAPGGLMVYATCSILADENEGQIAHFIGDHPDAQVVPQQWGGCGKQTPHGLQILPGELHMDGFFYSVLSKSF